MEYVNFKDKTNGAIRTYNTQYMRIKPAWKATASVSSDSLNLWLYATSPLDFRITFTSNSTSEVELSVAFFA